MHEETQHLHLQHVITKYSGKFLNFEVRNLAKIKTSTQFMILSCSG